MLIISINQHHRNSSSIQKYQKLSEILIYSWRNVSSIINPKIGSYSDQHICAPPSSSWWCQKCDKWSTSMHIMQYHHHNFIMHIIISSLPHLLQSHALNKIIQTIGNHRKSWEIIILKVTQWWSPIISDHYDDYDDFWWSEWWEYTPSHAWTTLTRPLRSHQHHDAVMISDPHDFRLWWFLMIMSGLMEALCKSERLQWSDSQSMTKNKPNKIICDR